MRSVSAECPQKAALPRRVNSEKTAVMTAFVRLRGLPFMTTDQELAQWFQTAPGGALQVVRVLFTFNTAGRKSGEAVRLSLPICDSSDPLRF